MAWSTPSQERSQDTSTQTKENLMEEIHFSKKKKKKANAEKCLNTKEKKVSLVAKWLSFLKSHVSLLLTTRWHLCTAFEMNSGGKKSSTCGVVRIESEVLLLCSLPPPPPLCPKGCRKEGLNLFCAFLAYKEKWTWQKCSWLDWEKKSDVFLLDESGEMMFCHSLDIDLKY